MLLDHLFLDACSIRVRAKPEFLTLDNDELREMIMIETNHWLAVEE